MLPYIESDKAIWLETTTLDHKHGGPGWEFGKVLWSPSRDKGGKDRYSAMRNVAPGDLVLHVLKRGFDGVPARLAGFSYCQKAAVEVTEEPPFPGDWKGMSPYYRVALEKYEPLEPALLIQDLFTKYDAEMRAITRTDEAVFFCEYGESNELRLRQGAYLTEVSIQLYSLFQSITGDSPGRERPLSEAVFKEGAEKRLIQTTKERDPKLKKAAIAQYGCKCMVCNFDFNKVYGEDLAAGYIELHHTKLLSQSQGETTTKIRDVVVVCSNCHRMIHRRREPIPWQELKSKLKPQL